MFPRANKEWCGLVCYHGLAWTGVGECGLVCYHGLVLVSVGWCYHGLVLVSVDWCVTVG